MFSKIKEQNGNVDPLYCPPVLLPIRSTVHSFLRQLFIFVLFEGYVRLRQFLGRALRLGRARGPSAAARTGGRALRLEVHLAAVKPRASRSDVQ